MNSLTTNFFYAEALWFDKGLILILHFKRSIRTKAGEQLVTSSCHLSLTNFSFVRIFLLVWKETIFISTLILKRNDPLESFCGVRHFLFASCCLIRWVILWLFWSHCNKSRVRFLSSRTPVYWIRFLMLVLKNESFVSDFQIT